MEKLTADQKKKLAAQIKTLDPKGEILTLSPNADFTGGTIVYRKDSGITLGENVTRLKDEEYVRAWLVVRLIRHFEYPADCLDIEHTYVQGRPSPTKAQIDIRVHDKRGKKTQTFMLVETKRPDDFDSYAKLIEDQLFATGQREHASGLRYAVWYTVEFRGNEPHDKCIIIDFRKFTEFKDWIEAGEPGHNLELPREYDVVRKPKFVKGKTDLRTDLTRADFTALQKDFHNQLWGGGGSSDSDVFVNLLKILIAKIYDEKTKDEGEAYDFQIELKDGTPETAEEIFAKVNRIYRDALRHYFKYDEEALRSAAISKEKLKPEKVAFIVERLEKISIIDNACDDDVLGAFFEAIVRDGFRQGKGQFFTHSNIARFILYALELDIWTIEYIHCPDHRIPFIIDPSCGSGTFLIEAMKVITDAVLHRHKKMVKKSDIVSFFLQTNFFPTETSKNAHNRWAKEYVYGIEDSEDLAMATKVNMILHGDGNANIQKGDGLADFRVYERDKLRNFYEGANHPYKFPRNEEFDCIVSNPPFSLKEDTRTLAQRSTRFAYADRKNSENLFIERYYQLLKPGGRMGVVLPDSVFDTNENLYMRLFLYRFFFIKAVVSLPQIAFQPYTPTKTSLLFAVKKKTTEVAAWDAAWREATNEYAKLRKSSVIANILANDRLRSGLVDLANRAEVEWYPTANLLKAESLPAGIRAQLTEACADSAGQKKKLAALLNEFDEFVATDALGKYSAAQEKESRVTIARLLRDKLTPVIAKLKFRELIESSYDDLVEAADLNHTEDPRGQNYCNAWWCFAEVTSKESFDYPIFFAEAGQVGYKRTTRHPEGIERPNDLFRTDSEGNIIIDTENPQTILENLRSRKCYQ